MEKTCARLVHFSCLSVLFFCSYSLVILLQVELLIPQLQFLDDEGAQAELWDLSRVFLDTLIEETGCQVISKFRLKLRNLVFGIDLLEPYSMSELICEGGSKLILPKFYSGVGNSSR